MIDRRSLMTSAAAVAVMGFARPALAVPAVEPPPPSAPIPGLTLAPELYPTIVTVRRDLEPGSIHVLSQRHYLYYIVRKGVAIRYGVAVGKAELVFRGAADVVAAQPFCTQVRSGSWFGGVVHDPTRPFTSLAPMSSVTGLTFLPLSRST